MVKQIFVTSTPSGIGFLFLWCVFVSYNFIHQRIYAIDQNNSCPTDVFITNICELLRWCETTNVCTFDSRFPTAQPWLGPFPAAIGKPPPANGSPPWVGRFIGWGPLGYPSPNYFKRRCAAQCKTCPNGNRKSACLCVSFQRHNIWINGRIVDRTESIFLQFLKLHLQQKRIEF